MDGIRPSPPPWGRARSPRSRWLAAGGSPGRRGALAGARAIRAWRDGGRTRRPGARSDPCSTWNMAGKEAGGDGLRRRSGSRSPGMGPSSDRVGAVLGSAAGSEGRSASSVGGGSPPGGPVGHPPAPMGAGQPAWLRGRRSPAPGGRPFSRKKEERAGDRPMFHVEHGGGPPRLAERAFCA